MNSVKPVFHQRECRDIVFLQDTGLAPVLQRIYSARGITSSSEIDYSLKSLIAPDQITQLLEAAALVQQHINNHSLILIFGDYDADGATSTALCIRALEMLGHDRVEFLLPDRIVDGYGLSLNMAEKIRTIKPDLVITVDTGIASFKGIDLLRQAEIDIIVTDHHLPAEQLPSANYIVNPNAFQNSAGKNLAGVGVAFYLMLALRQLMRESDEFDDGVEPNLAELLDLVAIGTVADLVPLDFNNRILVQQGLKRLRAGACSTGIKKLVEVSRRNLKTLTTQDIGFTIAPRINAAGRLDDMSIGVQTLLSQDEKSATELAYELDSINQYRREIQGQMTEQALAMVQKIQADIIGSKLQRSVVLYQADWHEGVVGIIASKIKEFTYRPVISFAANESGELKGSGRSIPGIHLRDMLDLVDKQQPGLILRFGGHAMAAGLSIQLDKLDDFRRVFEQVLSQHVDASCFNNIVEHDGEIESSHLNLAFARVLRESGPWGQRFPLPTFYGEFKALNQIVLADKHLKLTLTPMDDSQQVEAILFFATDEQLKTNFQQLIIHYELNVNEFRNEENVQLLIRHIV